MAEVTYARGLEGVIAAESKICRIDGQQGKLYYRGYSIQDLEAHCSYEEVTYLLLYGDLPNKNQLDEFSARMRRSRDLAPGIQDMIRNFPPGSHPMELLQSVVAYLSGYVQHRIQHSATCNCRDTLHQVVQIASVIATYARVKEDKDYVAPRTDLSHCANFLYMLKGEEPDPMEGEIMDKVLLLHAEHGFNASTFTSRVVASTLSTCYCSISAAMGSLYGSLHGGANEKVVAMVEEIGEASRAKDWVNDALDRKQRVMMALDSRCRGMSSKALGIDIGALTVKWVLLDATGQSVAADYDFHRGRPLPVLRGMLEALGEEIPAHVAVTGSGAALLPTDRHILRVDAVQATIAATMRLLPQAQNVIDIGGASVKLIRLDEQGRFCNFAANTQCAAGTGSFLDEQAQRLGLSHERMAELRSVADPPPVATRCAVFAKSDLIHLQQSGASVEQMWSGLCRGMAQTALQTLLKGKPLGAPTALVGGVARNREVLRWLGELSSFEVIKLMAKYTVARILERDDFTNRLAQGHPISTHELLYPLMQAYDSVALEADVEMGGTDQKFNLLVGRDIQREFGQEPQIVHTMPLLEGLDGVEKMSKSLDNYVGITEPPQEIFGKLMSISDPLMFRYYELLTDVPLARIEAMRDQAASGTVNPRDLKVELAKNIVTDFCGEAAARRAAEEFDRIFTQREIPADMEEVGIPLDRISLLDLLTEHHLLPSRGEAKRMIRQGGIYLDGQRAEDISLELDLGKQPEVVIRIGKKRFYRIIRTPA